MSKQKIELERDDFSILLFALGLARGACRRQGEEALARSIGRLTNQVILMQGNRLEREETP